MAPNLELLFPNYFSGTYGISVQFFLIGPFFLTGCASNTFSVPCMDFDENADCATIKANGQCEIDGKDGEIARFRCYKTCTGC